MKSKYSGAAYLTRLALLLAIVIIMTVFNFGNIPIGPIVATIYQVPVIIGAVILGTSGGCILGAAWGIICFILALTGQTTDIVALAVVQQNPLLYFAIAFVPRLLTGLFAGLIFAGMHRLVPRKYNTVSFAVSGVFGSLTNTVFYLGALYLFIKELLSSLYSIEIGAVGAMVLGVAVSNGLLEALVSALVVAAVCTAVTAVEKTK